MVNTERLHSLMERDGVDVLVAASPESTLYLSGAFIFTQELIRERLGLVVVPRSGEPAFIVSRMEQALAKHMSPSSHLHPYTYVEFGNVEASDAPVPVAVERIREWGLEGSVVAVEKSYLSADLYEILCKLLPKARIIDGSGLLAESRWVKSQTEVDCLRRAARATESAVWEAFSTAQIGWTEKQIADRIAGNLLRNGADTVVYVFLACGERGTMSHWIPGATPVHPGDIVRVDVAARFSGYWSDFARTVVAGLPSPEQTRIYRTIVSAHKRLTASMQAGLPIAALYRMAGQMLSEGGLQSQSLHIGHGLGTQLHERPMIAPFEPGALEPGMVLNLEIFYRDGVRAAYHVEDLVLVTADGPEVLTRQAGDEGFPVLGDVSLAGGFYQ